MNDGERGEYVKLNTPDVVNGGRHLAANICSEAANAIGPGQEREQTHGKMEESFQVAAGLWSAYLRTTIRPEDVAACMGLLKFSRIATGDATRKDHYVDIAGYAGLQGALANAK
jgi:hypothetical protein